MASKAFHIELRVSNVDDDEMLEAVRQLIKRCGRQAHAGALLIVGEKGDPEVTMYGDDLRHGTSDILLYDAEDKEDD